MSGEFREYCFLCFSKTMLAEIEMGMNDWKKYEQS